MSATDWARWHEAYADPDSNLSRRLRVVQRLVGGFLDASGGARVRVLSLCAGEGRDLLGVLATHPAAARVDGRLIELDPELAAVARARAAELGLPGIEVVVGDAGDTSLYAGAVPADLVLTCGVFGNIGDSDVERTVRAMPQLCAPGGCVIWTRHRQAPDLTPSIRSWFEESGFAERAFESAGPGLFGVGMDELRREPLPLRAGERLFSFVR